MSLASAPPMWAGHPCAVALLRFNLMAPELIDPAQLARFIPAWLRAPESCGRGAQRHASAALLKAVGAAPVRNLFEPVLPLCLAEPALLRRLALWSGLALLGPAIRRTIARSEVALLERELGADALAFARGPAMRLWAGPDAPILDAPNVRMQAQGLGDALLCVAFGAATPDVASRARLRLAPDADRGKADLPETLTHGVAAVEFGRSVLHLLDPAWLSSFPDPR